MTDNLRLDRLEEDVKTLKQDAKLIEGRVVALETFFTSIIDTQGQIKESLSMIIDGKTFICGKQQQKVQNIESSVIELKKEVDVKIGRIEGVGISLGLVFVSAIITLFLSVFK